MRNLLRMRPVYAFRRKIECTNNNGSQENCSGMESIITISPGKLEPFQSYYCAFVNILQFSYIVLHGRFFLSILPCAQNIRWETNKEKVVGVFVIPKQTPWFKVMVYSIWCTMHIVFFALVWSARNEFHISSFEIKQKYCFAKKAHELTIFMRKTAKWTFSRMNSWGKKTKSCYKAHRF